jgi:hypothetical protein
MQQLRFIALAINILCFACWSQFGYASSSGTAVGQPGGKAVPSFTLDFGSFAALTNISFNWEYDTTYLSFDKAQSTIDYGGQNRSLAAFIDYLKSSFGSPQYFSTEGGSTGASSKIYDYTIFADNGITLPGPAVFNLVFDLSDQMPAGLNLPIKVAGNLVDADWNEYPYEMQLSVQAVPEPESWLFLLSGLGLLALKSARSARHA